MTATTVFAATTPATTVAAPVIPASTAAPTAAAAAAPNAVAVPAPSLPYSDHTLFSPPAALFSRRRPRHVLVFMGAAPVGRTVVWGDNSAVVGVAGNSQSPSQMRHVLRRIKHIQELTEEHFEQRHVDDKNNVIDFYGKYVSGKKAAQSVMYISNRQMQAPARG